MTALVSARRGHGSSTAQLESLHLRPEAPGYNDSSYLWGRGSDGTALVARLSIRTHAKSEVWFSFRAPGQPIAAVEPPLHPHDEGMAAGGLRLDVLEPGKRWRIEYSGPLRRDGRSIDCEASLQFRSDHALVDFSHAVAPATLARALAAQPWSRRFFEQLEEIRTIHYEQAGRLTGTITLGGHEHAIDVPSLRDHSFGRRRWSSWRRHFWFTGLCEDGRSFNATRIRYDFVGPLVAGFLQSGGGEPVAIEETSPFEIFGAPGQVPRTAELWLTARGGRRHRLVLTTDGAFEFAMDDGAYVIHEGIATFELDGVPGVGIAELGWAGQGNAESR